ncbi:acyl-CoA thioesterase [Ruminococcus sp.]|uniref:acyl-CoA thioesterase n=1 Tax=Ruminococcus sp. TaxID=41978 RepID=UPI0025DEB7A7|nr:acyl-CoA thioesterase [Ruminococcus sp.]MBQ8965110.1 acyl-CoA thioesterase [Ruminococcus sp.]
MKEYVPYRRKAYYYETDRMDIVHHSNYVRWLEEARVDMMEQLGCPFEFTEKQGIVSPVLSVSCEYKYPVRFGDEFEVVCKLLSFNGCRFELEYEVTNLTTGQLSLIAKTSHCFTGTDLRPIRMQKKYPELYDNLLKALEDKGE